MFGLALITWALMCGCSVAQTERPQLTRAALMAGEPSLELTPTTAFMSGANAEPAIDRFEGVLHVVAASTGVLRPIYDGLSLLRDASLQIDVFPEFDVTLLQDGDWLIPTLRGPVGGVHPHWEVAVEPGRVWSEPGDAGLTRAALPFALIEVNANCTHNGMLTFLFHGGEISHVAWQIASETCQYLKFDFWGVTSARYEPMLAPDHAEIVAAFRAEQARRIQMRPIAALAEARPGLDVGLFSSPADVDPADLTAFGVFHRGVHYVGDCATRAGPYPDCGAMLLPSYSVAKSIAAGLGLMRLEALHPGAMRERIADHAEPCRDWGAVSFENALDMATGRYDSAESEVDENQLTSERFFLAPGFGEKLGISCGRYPRREAAGRTWVYHTSDTFVLGAAMANYWRGEHGPAADFFNDVLVDGIYARLGLSPTIRATRRTYDAARQPFMGWGLTLLPDDIARLAAYLQNPESADVTLIAPRALAAAMQRDPSDTGLLAADSNLRYNNGFWAWNAQNVLRCAHPVWIPFMSGYGGIVVALMPNGLSYYHFGDGGEQRWAHAVLAADQIAPLCEERP